MKQQTNQSRLRDQRNPTVSKYRVRSFIVASHHEEAFTQQIQYSVLPEVQHKTHSRYSIPYFQKYNTKHTDGDSDTHVAH